MIPVRLHLPPDIPRRVLLAGLLAAPDQGLRVKAALDENTYEPGINVSDSDLAAINLRRDEFHGEWNYRVRPSVVAKHG